MLAGDVNVSSAWSGSRAAAFGVRKVEMQVGRKSLVGLGLCAHKLKCQVNYLPNKPLRRARFITLIAVLVGAFGQG